MWNNETELNFMEIYQTVPVLWEPNNKFHKDKKKLHDAWVRISEQTGFPVIELKKKKDSLMATYRGHLRKIQNSLKSGTGLEDVHKPIWFAFNLMDSFLGHLYKCKNTINTENQNDRPSISTENNEREENQEETINEENIEDAAAHCATTEQDSIDPPATQRRRKNPPELIEAGKNMKDAISTLNKVLKKKETQEDDCDRYGKILANKLRKLSEEERLHMMYEIDGLFIKQMQNKSSPNARYYNVPSSRHYSVPPRNISPKHYIISPSPSPTYSRSNSSYSLYSESASPRPSSISEPSLITNVVDNIPVLHIPETSQAITEQAHPPSQQITILSNEVISTPQTDNDIINTAFYHA